MSYNTDFLIAAMIIQLIILCHFSAQKRPADLNNQLFLILSVLVSLDIAFEVLSTCLRPASLSRHSATGF